MAEGNKAYTNEELAKAWFSVAAQYSSGQKFSLYLKRKAVIAACPVNLYEFYQEHRTLRGASKDLRAPSTLGVLETILEKGINQAREIGAENNLRANTTEHDRTICRTAKRRQRVPEEPSPYGENAYKAMEERS